MASSQASRSTAVLPASFRQSVAHDPPPAPAARSATPTTKPASLMSIGMAGCPAEGAQVDHHATGAGRAGIAEGVLGSVAGRLGIADNLPGVVDGVADADRPAERAQVVHDAARPGVPS